MIAYGKQILSVTVHLSLVSGHKTVHLERPQVLRVVGCLPLGQDGRGTTILRGQASYKPQGRKPRNGPVRFAQQRWLWGLLT
jgi:hypothetical protein